MAKTIHVFAESYKEIGKAWIKRYPNMFGGMDVNRIAFIKETEKPPKKKGKKTFAVTRKLSQYAKLLCDDAFDYVIIFNEQEIQAAEFNRAQINALVGHEMWHTEPTGEKMRPHDIEDFSPFLKGLGVDWVLNKNIKDPLETDIKEFSAIELEEDEEN